MPPAAVKDFTHGAALLALTLLAGSTSQAQSEAAVASSPAKPKFAYVRFWNMLQPPPGSPPANSELQLLASDNQPLAAAPPSNFYASYTPVPPATYNFIVRRTHDAGAPLKRLPVLLRADTYITILASEHDNQPNVELIDDTIDPKVLTGLPGRVTVRQFMNGAQVKVVADGKNTTDLLSYGQTSVLDNLPTQVVPLTMQAVITGATRLWSTEVDFTTARHATLLVVADPYGRFRPRLAMDGQTMGVAPDAGQPPTSSTPTRPPASR